MTAARRSKEVVDRETPPDYRPGLEASHRGETRSLEALNTALDGYLACNDAKGAALASAALLLTGQLQSTYRRFPEHIARQAIARDPGYLWLDHDEELLALAGLLVGLNYFGPNDPFIETCVERIMGLLELDLDVNLRFAAGRAVMFYVEPRELRALGQRVFSLLRPSMDRTELTPHRLGHWLYFWSRCARYAKEEEQALLAEQQARKLAEEHGLGDILAMMAFTEVERSLPARDLARAERAMAAAEALADPARLGEKARLEFLRTKIALMKGLADGALLHASRATKYAIDVEYPPPVRGVYIVNEAQAHLFNDNFAEARALLREAIDLVPEGYAQEIRGMIALTEAYEATIAGDDDGRRNLESILASMRERQFYDTFDGFPEFGAKLCVLALEHSIETDYVRHLVELRSIAPPVNAPESWPWPIRIYALGGFQIYRGSMALAFEGKAQKKPMELFKVLIALGGRGIAREKLYDVLWTDAEPAAANAAFNMAISRLRKLLGDPDAIRIDESKVSLDTTRVWIDVWDFDHDVEALQSALHGQADGATIDRIGQRLLARYSGPFLGSEDPQRWSLAARDRWHSRFRRSLADAGVYWEQKSDWARAIALYERALEVDSLAEDLYRRLMRAHLARDEPAEAARVYRRCRDMLSVQLGIPPAPATESLFKSIYGN